MRAYKVQTPSGAVRYAGTQAEAKKLRNDLAEEHDLKKAHVEVEEVEIPTDKAGLLAFVNLLCASEANQ